jgi:anti-sigma regulatory factor (Ser/Thr protein kinase)
MQARTALPAEAQSVRAARRFVTSTLAGRGFSADLVDTAALLVSELVSNAVLHARSRVDVLVDGDADRVRVVVHDLSRRSVVRRRHQVDSATGRGLVLLERLSADWGVQMRSDGKDVWFELRAGQPDAEPDLDLFLDLDDGVA